MDRGRTYRESPHLRKIKEPLKRERLRFGIDVDGTITQAPRHFKRVIDALLDTGNYVCIVTARFESTRRETERFLNSFHIRYDDLIMRPDDWPDSVPQYKVKIAREQNLHMMFDDDEANCWAIELETQALAAHMLPIPEMPEEWEELLE